MDQESPIEELNRFRQYESTLDNLEIPLRPENRRRTDKKYVVTFITLVVILIPFMIYTLNHADFKHLAGSDDCGNFCGYKNEKYDEWNCTGQDFTEKKYLATYQKIRNDYLPTSVFHHKICVEKCPPGNIPGFEEVSCEDNLNKSDAAEYEKIINGVEEAWWVIVLSVIITCSLCFGMILLFRYAVDYTVWGLLIGSIGVLMIFAGRLWMIYFYYPSTSDEAHQYLIYAGGLSIFVLFLIVLVSCMIERVKLIIELFKEASKAIFEIPGLIHLPVLTFAAVALTMIVLVVLTLYSFTASVLMEIRPNQLDYELNGAILFTILYNIFVCTWFMQFMVSAQYMIIAGAISAWFFTRNKNYLDSPLWTSFVNFIKFHLGTVLIGSLILTIVKIIRMILRALSSNNRTRWLVECCCGELIAFLKLFSNNAYIQTAMHGQSFFKSGKRAVMLLVSNAENVVAINSIGSFVLVIAQFVIMVVGGVIALWIASASGNPHQAYNVGAICCILTICIVIIFFNIFEATIDSIFMCFCEDTLINDGMARPFFMSKGLHQFIQNCKGVIPAKK
ncbi:choline transporter-like protein 1 [Coccinella septempunctata]|uniref:choline transporter-like protein 1 n=1 Tax=Coccinella septempunctata TaxID=41139 RepID=UPI001D090356|nr:choline transporter-like protein 1 [Coccinella septempunctata]XP_044756927.1 choline transporter-like protein 1 [Coccinella septempunctata]